MAENFPNLGKETDIQVQEVQRTPNKMNTKKPTLEHLIIKMVKIKYKEKNLKSSKKKSKLLHMSPPIRQSADFSAAVTILISDKIDFKRKMVMRPRWSLYNDKGVNSSRDTTVVNICAPNIGAPKYIRPILTDLKGKIENNIMIVGSLNILL